MLMASMRPCLLRCSARVAPQRRLAVGLRAAHSDTYAAAPPPAPAADLPVVNMVSLAGVVVKKPWFQDYGTSQKASLNIDVKRRASKQKTNEIKVVAWGELARFVTVNVQQGASVTLTGELVHNSWQDKTTEEWKSEVIVVADKLQIYAAGQAPLIAEHAPPQHNAPHQNSTAPHYNAPAQHNTQYDAQHDAPDAGYQQQQQQQPVAPAAAQGAPQPLTTAMKPTRMFSKMSAVYAEVAKNIYAFADVARGFGIQPYTALNYAITQWEVSGSPLDLGVVALVLDIGLPGEQLMELGPLMEAVSQTYRDAGTDPTTHHVSVRAVRANLMSTHMAAVIETQERQRNGPSVTYTQITFAESLYRRGVLAHEVENAMYQARVVLDQQTAAQQQQQQQPLPL